MIKDIISGKEKKVEYVELIYDLIFVYIIGRNNLLLHHTENGFLHGGMIFAFVLCTLAIIQIWNFTTYYINIYGKNSPRNYIFMFINMFLLYFIAEGTQLHWQGYFIQYHIAWALILINIGVQYLFEIKGDECNRKRAFRMALILFIEAAIICLSILEYYKFDTNYLSLAAIIFGIAGVFTIGQRNSTDVDFPHLSERAMLYVVFTFGEMIIAIASYFEGDFTASNIYFSAMAFLIVVALFLSYGVTYDHIIDREMKTNGLGYMFLHIFIISSLSCITVALEFMTESSIALMPKIIMLIGSFIVYYIFLFATGKYAKNRCHPKKSFYVIMALIAISFAALMLIFRNYMKINIAITVIYVYAVFAIIYKNALKMEKQ